MKTLIVFAIAALLAAPPAAATERTLSMQARTRIIDGDRVWHESRAYTYGFRVEVLSDRAGLKPEGVRDGHPFIEAFPGEEYRVRLHNPLPVRVAVNLSIDGLNSITARPGTPAGGAKWVIEPESWIEIAGWQISDRAARRFFFTSRQESYARWRSNDWGRDLSVNCGVIGAAYFWSQRELDDYFDDHPVVIPRHEVPITREDSWWSGWWGGRGMKAGPPAAAPSAVAPVAPREEQRAGTGMGERESHPVRDVRFDFDRGMYRPGEAVVIAYDFLEERRRQPQPFEERRGYAPEPDPDWGWERR